LQSSSFSWLESLFGSLAGFSSHGFTRWCPSFRIRRFSFWAISPRSPVSSRSKFAISDSAFFPRKRFLSGESLPLLNPMLGTPLSDPWTALPLLYCWLDGFLYSFTTVTGSSWPACLGARIFYVPLLTRLIRLCRTSFTFFSPWENPPSVAALCFPGSLLPQVSRLSNLNAPLTLMFCGLYYYPNLRMCVAKEGQFRVLFSGNALRFSPRPYPLAAPFLNRFS